MKILFTAILACCLAGCGAFLKTPYQQPELNLPQDWQNKQTGTAWLTHTPQWWRVFNDPQFSQMISDVLIHNDDLAIAGYRLRQAALDAGLSNTNLTPDVSAGGEASNSKNTRRNTAAHENYNASVTTSYELDLWGKLARTREQAQWQMNATALDRQNTALMLIGTTGQYYWQIAALNEQIGNTEKSIQLAMETERITRSGYEAGAINQLDVLQARQSVIDQTNSLRELNQQREEARNALAILFGRAPSARAPEKMFLDPRQTIGLTPDLPLSVISRRPDVQSAEWKLRASLAASDVARLNFYPSLSLGATLGAGSAVFSEWFSNPARTLSSGLTLPFVQWNTVQLTVERSELDVRQAAATFRQSVYSALSDVENTTSQRNTYQAQREDLLVSLGLGEQRLRLAKSQYLAGAVSLQTWLDAQSSLLSAENQLADAQARYLNATLQLWLALGGEVNLDEIIASAHVNTPPGKENKRNG
ncbi:efflux transporter outer membrane subunit [Rahnella aquatilis]|uniref:Efflux transporter, outer membrane factor lipoprotein, NodT family n=1 Tax=Rahnella aquatilis (strain ATCC 33071 / DSM 4594 / JCM 1683 / NBRC 105701 / NCIMB 13365 / CIP 78.65) TaxID=745277 RepID=H2J0G6_RAHAC|nr:efflux transporter outer membrane subunit [Rahnella aquatilis]AEX50015.1 efflux transporter, outer membrane factor lipoprotein, NodT family [Rahnella aquatilis CIP 78.65 = ATCC 33071]KFD00731.1 RND efflux system outer membrane lipoprotein [Rahnella aquatilis CIP 78.65 = ATCC 33071]